VNVFVDTGTLISLPKVHIIDNTRRFRFCDSGWSWSLKRAGELKFEQPIRLSASGPNSANAGSDPDLALGMTNLCYYYITSLYISHQIILLELKRFWLHIS